MCETALSPGAFACNYMPAWCHIESLVPPDTKNKIISFVWFLSIPFTIGGQGIGVLHSYIADFPESSASTDLSSNIFVLIPGLEHLQDNMILHINDPNEWMQIPPLIVCHAQQVERRRLDSNLAGSSRSCNEYGGTIELGFQNAQKEHKEHNPIKQQHMLSMRTSSDF